MAITEVQPLVLILLVTFFFLPALSEVVPFRNCEGLLYPADVNSVDISPYPIERSGGATISISGDISGPISEVADLNVFITGHTSPVFAKLKYILNDATNTPLESGFLDLSLPNMFTETQLLGRTDDSEYNVTVNIFDKEFGFGDDIMVCIEFTCDVK